MLICPTAGLVETSHSHYFTVSSLLPAFKKFCKTASNAINVTIACKCNTGGTHIFEMAKFSNYFYLGDLCKV